MIGLLCFGLAILISPFRSKSRLEAENAVLRHQLIVLRRKMRGRPQLTNNGRWFFIQLYRWFPAILQLLTIIRPDTLVRWHRAGFRRYWSWKARPRGGRPQIETELRVLTRRPRPAAYVQPQRAPFPMHALMAERSDVERLAEAAHLSVQQFSRAFIAATGMTPAKTIERLRAEVAYAKAKEGRETLETIAQAVGFADPERMRRSFIPVFRQTPQAMRRLTRPLRRPISQANLSPPSPASSGASVIAR